MKHKHAEIIKAWADGVKCEYLFERTKKWCEIKELVTFDAYETVRIKPEPLKEQYQLNIQISQLENQLQACITLVDEQDKKIVELATKLAYANRSIEIFNEEEEQEPKYLYVYDHEPECQTWMSFAFRGDAYGEYQYMGKVRLEK
jgi:hypothetical protein